MANRRLLAILIVFIVLGGLAIAGGTIFVVRNVEIQFTNTLEYLQGEREVIQGRLHTAASDIARGRSSLFGVNRDAIAEAIEEEEFRVRVTNIEVVFPNRIVISVRERYPVFEFVHAGNRYILCRELRFITHQIYPVRELIQIPSDQIIVTNPERRIALGEYLDDFFPPNFDGTFSYHYQEERLKIRRVRDVADFFFSRANYEDAFSHMFTRFAFVQRGGARVDMYLYWHTENATVIVFEGIGNDLDFNRKLVYVMYVKEIVTNNMASSYRVRIWIDGRLSVEYQL